MNSKRKQITLAIISLIISAICLIITIAFLCDSKQKYDRSEHIIAEVINICTIRTGNHEKYALVDYYTNTANGTLHVVNLSIEHKKGMEIGDKIVLFEDLQKYVNGNSVYYFSYELYYRCIPSSIIWVLFLVIGLIFVVKAKQFDNSSKVSQQCM